MLDDTRSRLLNNPVTKVARWTLPWLVLALVGWYLWGFYAEFQLNRGTAASTYVTPEQAAMQTTPTTEATTSPVAGQIGIALVDGVRLRTTPTAKGQVTASVGKGTRLALLEKKDDWYRVRDPLGHIGWVTASDKFIQVVAK